MTRRKAGPNFHVPAVYFSVTVTLSILPVNSLSPSA
jgi:hypothetical protein